MINSDPYREYYNSHSSDIFNINWNNETLNLILTSSSDYTVLLYDIEFTKPIKIFKHPDLVSDSCFKNKVSYKYNFIV